MALRDISELKESETLELKGAEHGLPLSFWDTYSSFANTEGGTIYLGIKEVTNGNEVIGVKNPKQMIDAILATSRNKTKVSLPLINESNIEVIEIEGKQIIKVDIPEAPRNEKPVFLNSNLADSYIRVGEGDYKAEVNEIRSMLIDNSTENYDYLPNKMNYGFEDVNIETLHSFREKYEIVHPRSYYSSLSDKDFLNAIGAFAKNSNGEPVLTNGALLMFSNYFKIVSVFQDYLLDYREASSFEDKWNYRIVADDMGWSGNMFDFYSLVYQRAEPFMPKPYIASKDQDIGSLKGQAILRELLVNALSNYAVLLYGGLTILLTGDKLIERNAGRVKVGLKQALKGGKSGPRNAQIHTFFRLLGISDKAGTGIPNLFSSAESLSLPTPLLTEQAHPEETSFIIYLKKKEKEGDELSVNKRKALEYIASKGKAGARPKDIQDHLGFSRTYVNNIIKELQDGGFIESNNLPTSGRKYFVK